MTDVGEVVARQGRRPIVLCVVLVYAFTWVVWVPRAAGVPVGVVGQLWTWMPAVAAVVAAALTGGRTALRDLGSRLVRWRVGWGWWLLVIAGPAAFSILVAGVYGRLGGSAAAAVPSVLTGSLIQIPLVLAILAITDGLGEEPAWRGFMLPRMLAYGNALAASLVLGVVWALWHLPLQWTAGYAQYQLPVWLLVLDVSAKSVIFTWVFLRTRGSALIAIVLHASMNVFVVSPAEAVTGDLWLPILATAAKWVLVAVMVIACGSRLAPRRQRQLARISKGRSRVPD
jgi:membrane protease YdiL (CAAX protease family)